MIIQSVSMEAWLQNPVSQIKSEAEFNLILVALSDKSEIKLLPHGIHHESATKCIIGNGVVIDPKVILSDFQNLSSNGIDYDKKLLVSER